MASAAAKPDAPAASQPGGKNKTPDETPAERATRLLRDYMQVPKNRWGELRPGDLVRYYVKPKDGGEPKFHAGGRVVAHRINANSGNAALKLKPEFGKGEWIVRWDSVVALYIAVPLALRVLKDALEGSLRALNNNITKIHEMCQRLDRRMGVLEGRKYE